MAITKSAQTLWVGDLMSGRGKTTFLSSNIGTFDVTWKARAESSNGLTSPEELIGAAHSACFSMAFTHELHQQHGITPNQVDTVADVMFQPGEGITGINLILKANIDGISETDFQRIAELAKTNCPVSQALAGVNISLDAKLNLV